MTKSELIASIATKTGLTKKTAEEVLEAFIGTVSESLSKGIWKEDETMTEGGLFIFLVILVLFVITVAVVTVVSAVTSAVAAIAQKDLEEDE